MDSGIAAMYTQISQYAGDGDSKPEIELNFKGCLDEELLKKNIIWWKEKCFKI